MKRALLLACLAWAVTASAQVPTYVPTDGLQVWTEFDGHYINSLDGQVAWMEIGNPIFTNGRFIDDEAIRFPASGNFLKSSTPWYLPSQDHTTSLWFKSDDAQNSNQSIINSDPHTIIGVGINPWWSYTTSTIGACIGPGVGYWDMCGQFETISADYEEWNHLVTVRTGSEVKLFLNNTLVFERSGVAYNSTTPTDILLGESSHTTGFTDHEFIGVMDQFGFWSRPLNEEEISSLFMAQAPDPGCTDDTACNFDAEANVDDGSCIPSGCMEEAACNFNADAQCEGEACDYSCCPGPGCCGDGMHWDADAQTCVITPPSIAPDTECTLLNLQELAEGYQILLAQNAELDSLLADCNGTSTSDPPGPCSGEDVVTYHGYDYDIVEIGDQCWFAENLQTTTFNSGEPLLTNLTEGEWGSATSPACAIYGEQDSPCQQEQSLEPYCSNSFLSLSEFGRLYNGQAIVDSRNLCPVGWHVSTDDDFSNIELHLGMTPSQVLAEDWRGTDEGTKLKSTSGWHNNGNGSNLIGFGAVPAGYRAANGAGHRNGGGLSYFWTSTMSGSELYRRVLTYSRTDILRSTYPIENYGFSVRCVKD